MSAKRYGVRLTLPGAPAEPHTIPGLHLLVRPDEITAIETDDDLQRARDLQEAGADIEVVELDEQLSGDALKQRASDLNIEGRSAMNADQLRAAVLAAETDTTSEES